jgi:hypothetical protein
MQYRVRNNWLGREDSNLRMAESKSKWFALIINARSEKSRKFDINPYKRLANISECRASGFRRMIIWMGKVMSVRKQILYAIATVYLPTAAYCDICAQRSTLCSGGWTRSPLLPTRFAMFSKSKAPRKM